MTTERWLAVAGAAAAVGGVIGLWFWQQEANYARMRGGSLAPVLQWVGVGMFLLAVAVCALAAAVWSITRGEAGFVKEWLPFALRTPSRVVALALVAASLVVVVLNGDRDPQDYVGPSNVFNLLGAVSIMWIVFGWRQFWSGGAVRRTRARREGE